MPKIPTTSPVTGAPLPPHYIHTLSSHFVDQTSRVRILRGVNLCGSSKSPVGKPSWILDGFWEAVEAADGDGFVGRPLELTKEELQRMQEEGYGNVAATTGTGNSTSPGSDGRIQFGALGELGEADVHLARLRGWGFTLLRFVFTWEALEHAGPGKYDEAFIDHLILVLQKCKAHGFLVFLDPHQDIWSRFTGGSGAPYWTLLACGINPRSMTATQAALLHNEYPLPSQPNPEAFPKMIWGTNYFRLASQTVFTLFFAGRDYAPKCMIDGVNIQDYLQNHFIDAVAHLAKRIRDAGGLFDECIIGWDSINEPHEGLVGYEDLRVIPAQQALKKGSSPTVAQSLRLGMGMKQDDIEWWDFGSFGPRRNGSVDIDPNGVKLWVDEDVADEQGGLNGRWGWKRGQEWALGQCIWALHGVWKPSAPERDSPPSSPTGNDDNKDQDTDILIPDYFFYKRGDDPVDSNRKVDFIEDYFRPHLDKYFGALRKYHPELIPFIQPPVFHPPPWLNSPDPEDPSTDLLKGRGCFSTHYYDGLTLMTRHWNWFNADALGVLRGKYSSPVFAVKIGDKAIRKSIREQLGVLKADCAERMGEFPIVFGEIGIPMELDDKYSYGGPTGRGKGKGDYREQVKALDASLFGTDGRNMTSYTIWTYCSDSSHTWGDGWNGEDLSLWCAEDERTGGSTTGRRGFRRKPYIETQPSSRDEKAQLRIEVQQANAEESANESANEGSSTPPEPQELQPWPFEDVVGYQISSTLLELSDLVSPKLPSIPSTMALTDPSSSRATLLPAYTKLQPIQNADTLSFPSFHSAPLAFAFLTNGARAWKAFVRTYPLAVVGLPQTWEWDCNKAVFEMKVRVGPEDRAVNGDSEDSDGPDTGFVEQEYATEIFVPLLHFAKNEVVKKAFGVPLNAKDARHKSALSGPGSTNTLPLAAAAVAVAATVPLMADNSTVALPMEGDATRASESTQQADAATLASVGQVLEGEISMDNALDLDVSVNAGHWSVEGQVLKWWYPIPTATAASTNPATRSQMSVNQQAENLRSKSTTSLSGQAKSNTLPKVGPDGKVEYTITIKRRGGPIQFKKLGVSENWVGLGPRESKASVEGRKANGRKNDCCGNNSGCIIV